METSPCFNRPALSAAGQEDRTLTDRIGLIGHGFDLVEEEKHGAFICEKPRHAPITVWFAMAEDGQTDVGGQVISMPR